MCFRDLIEQLPNDVIFSIKDEDDSLLDNFMENAERYNLYTYKSNKFNDCCIIS